MKPQLHQKATFYPHSFADDNTAVEAVVTRIWSDSCVNLALLDEQGQIAGGPTSVFVYDAASTALPKPAGYYCVLQPIEADQYVRLKILGARELSPDDAALMNEIKAQGEVISQLLVKVSGRLADEHLAAKSGNAELIERHTLAEPHRWLAMARTDFQAGLMKLTRAVAQPSGF